MSTPTSVVGMQRKLVVIFSTDVAGYSRLTGDDEEAPIRLLTASREVISSLIQHYPFSLEIHRQRMPIKDPAVLERRIAALRKAGLKL